MTPDFWHERWSENRIGFHEKTANPLLVDNVKALALPENARVFVPLCGKSNDLTWLLAQGHHVVGIELSDIAITDYFKDLNITPEITETNDLTRYTHKNLTLFVGDIFKLTKDTLGPVDAIYDRAALVALPFEMREDYTAHLIELTDAAPQLLITFDYDQSKSSGPPFAISKTEVNAHYATTYTRSTLRDQPISGPLGQRTQGRETVWHLTPKG